MRDAIYAHMSAYLEGADFPCSKEELIEQAEENNATDDVINMMQRLPDKIFVSVSDVVDALQIAT